MDLGHFSKEDPNERMELMERLGKGSYGEVFKGRLLQTSEIVAVKMITLEEADGGMESVRKEIHILQACNHRNIVRYYGSYLQPESLWVG